MKSDTSTRRLYLVLSAVLLSFMLLSLFLGRYSTPPGVVVNILKSRIMGTASHTIDEAVVWDIRMPRVLLCVMVGAGLSIAGAAFQGIFQNPLVSPDILGVSAGAGFGAAWGILLTSGATGVTTVLAFCFGLLSVGAAYAISKIKELSSPLSLVLSGMIVSLFFSALISLIKLVADTESTLPAITYWLMGSFANTTFAELALVSPGILGGIGILLLLRWRINILSMGDEEAYALGINAIHMRIAIILSATLITASSVTISGVIGWVGLIVPNICRLFIGADHQRLLPLACLVGGLFMLCVDFLSRILTVAEIPVGILTALTGVPLFIAVYKYSTWGA